MVNELRLYRKLHDCLSTLIEDGDLDCLKQSRRWQYNKIVNALAKIAALPITNQSSLSRSNRTTPRCSKRIIRMR